MKTRNIQSHWQYSKGSTLIEVLIAAIVIGIGLLGVAALQLKALQGSSDAQYRSTATDVAWALGDRMRANLAADNDYSNKASDCEAAVMNCSMAPDASDTSGVDICAPSDIAAYDIQQVVCNAALPEGELSIAACRTPGAVAGDACDAGSAFDITVSWKTRAEYDKDDWDDDGDTYEDYIVMTVIPGTDPGAGL